LTLCIGLASGAWVKADEVLFTNGDRLTGKIVGAADGKLKIKSDLAGEVSVDLSKVRTFTTDEPVELHVGEGNVLKSRVSAGPDGSVQAAGGGGVAAQAVALKDVRKINPPPVKWTGAITATGLLTRGNSDTDNLGISIDAVRRAEQDRITFGAGYLYGRQRDTDTGDKETTTDNWFIFGKYDYFFNDKLYAFASARVERDRIALLDLRFSPAVGLGYQWIEKEDFNFFTEAGLGWVYEDFSNAGSNDYFAARLAYHVDKKLNDKVALFHNLEYVPSLEDAGEFNINADAGVRATLTDNMFTEFKFEWKHDSEPAPGADKNDLRYILGVGWSF
jgi:putative salt-induced outer membrane protein YdiY